MQADGQPLSGKGNEGTECSTTIVVSLVSILVKGVASDKKSFSPAFPELDSEICHD